MSTSSRKCKGRTKELKDVGEVESRTTSKRGEDPRRCRVPVTELAAPWLDSLVFSFANRKNPRRKSFARRSGFELACHLLQASRSAGYFRPIGCPSLAPGERRCAQPGYALTRLNGLSRSSLDQQQYVGKVR